MKHYVICIDGTWNEPGQRDTNPLSNEQYFTETNVLRVFRGLTGVSPDPRLTFGHIVNLSSGDGEAIYLTGVGTTPGTEILQGLTGLGTAQRIAAAYQFLVDRYKSGDNIYGFGFSRGAFAVRSLAGFIQHVGLASKISNQPLQDIIVQYQKYALGDNLPHPEDLNHQDRIVHFLGLWDTVSAILAGSVDRNISPSNVLNVAHALALDEMRDKFTPEYWARPDGSANASSVEEVWFCGSHSNVGGGYVDDNLSNIAFFWVLGEAESKGLKIDLPSMPFWIREHAGSTLRSESHRSFWRFLKYFKEQKVRNIIKGQRIHESVVERIRDKTLQPSYIPKATSTARFWELIDDPQWQTEWMKLWGFKEQSPEKLVLEDETQILEIPNELVSEVLAMVNKYYNKKAGGAIQGQLQQT
jgi:hypothetical protein